MSGREKRSPRTPEEEREQLRQLTRELHEAAQDARAAAKEVAAARDTTVEQVVRAATAELTQLSRATRQAIDSGVAALQRFERVVDERTAEAVQSIEENHAKLMGFQTGAEFAKWLLTEVYQSLSGDPVFARDVGRSMYEAYAESTEDPLIRVATKDMLDAYLAAGGNPGVVLDLRRPGQP